jgi:hypothetical protein
MGEVTVVPATLERWEEVVALLGGDGERGCWCQAWLGDRAILVRRDFGGQPAAGGD